MNTPTAWLPALVPLSSTGGDYKKYVDALYAHYERDFVHSSPTYPNRRFARRKFVTDGREAGFWHLISDGPVEADRLPDLRRSERICWPRAILDQLLKGVVRGWRNERKGGTHICLATEDFGYVVALGDHQKEGYVVLLTAYCVEESHRRAKMERECVAYQKAVGGWKG